MHYWLAALVDETLPGIKQPRHVFPDTSSISIAAAIHRRPVVYNAPYVMPFCTIFLRHIIWQQRGVIHPLAQ